VAATPPENRLDYWREDPLLNDHHQHWHLVYPASGRPSPSGTVGLGDRHGELFAYMHQQMIARYDAERRAVGLSRVQPFDDYRADTGEGYDSEAWLWNGSEWFAFRARPAGARIGDLPPPPRQPGWTIGEQETFRDRIFEASATGSFAVDGRQTPIEADSLGNTAEASLRSVDDEPRDTYGDLHNMGHVHFAYYDNQPPPGVMISTATAVRDPIFWRWHKHVDSVFHDWQKRQAPYDFSDGPPVRIRKAQAEGTIASIDIILCLKDGLPAEFDGEKLGSDAFGYSDDPDRNSWDEDFASATVTLPTGETITTTDELRTEMAQRTVNLVGADGNPVQTSINYLSHDDFFYFIRVENLSDQPQNVTARIFLAPETEVEDRASWIEMDKFLYRLDGSTRAVITRRADLSSVVRKPALKPEDFTLGTEEPSPKTGQQSWCDCGWPYTLLLPRGTREGMRFCLFVMFSDGNDLALPEQHAEHCTSVSYCGLQDEEYPDKRDMGYPFSRPFRDGIPPTVAAHDNMAWRTITIRCRNI
jgi:tyrosinase